VQARVSASGRQKGPLNRITSPQDLRAGLEAVLPPERVLTGALDRLAFANDASVYRLVPRGVVQAAAIDVVRGLFRLIHRQRVPVTFRAAGTSLSGQVVTDGILVDVSRHWRSVQLLEDEAAVGVQPGGIAAAVNRTLAPHGVRIRLELLIAPLEIPVSIKNGG